MYDFTLTKPKPLTTESFPVQLLSGIPDIVQAHQQAGQQPDNLCGPYWVSILLHAYGTGDISGDSISADHIAAIAGSVLPMIDPARCVPPGATSRQDYRVALPQTENAAESGTSVQGLIRAIAQVSNGQYALVPLRADWSADWIAALLDLCQSHPQWKAVPVCNIQTGPLWGSHLSLVDAIAYLNGQSIQPPPADWDVGHFVVLAGQVTGSAQALAIVQDTYPVLGWDGYHLQSFEAVAQALSRTDGHEGGVVLFVTERDRPEVEQCAIACGFTVSPWDNGSP